VLKGDIETSAEFPKSTMCVMTAVRATPRDEMKLTASAIFPLFFALNLAACGGGQRELPPQASPASTGSNPILGADTPAGHKQVMDALATTGHQCEDPGKAIACDAKKEGAFTFAVVFADAPRRLVFVVPSTLKVSCAEAAVRFNALNHEFDTVNLSCEGNDFAATGELFIPKAGLAAGDINAFLAPWLTQLATIIRANHLDEIVK
jgi:hypothetical protein